MHNATPPRRLYTSVCVHSHVFLCHVCGVVALQGFKDEAYKQRRVMIANIARQHEM